jgi:hypothetical protein
MDWFEKKLQESKASTLKQKAFLHIFPQSILGNMGPQNEQILYF